MVIEKTDNETVLKQQLKEQLERMSLATGCKVTYHKGEKDFKIDKYVLHYCFFYSLAAYGDNSRFVSENFNIIVESYANISIARKFAQALEKEGNKVTITKKYIEKMEPKKCLI